MSTIVNKLDTLFAMGYSADEIACAAREQEKEWKAARNLAERANARKNLINAFNEYHATLGFNEEIPNEVWDEVFDDYEKGLVMFQEHSAEFDAAINELASIFGLTDQENKEDDNDKWTIINEDELKEELKRKVTEFCEAKY